MHMFSQIRVFMHYFITVAWAENIKGTVCNFGETLLKVDWTENQNTLLASHQ